MAPSSSAYPGPPWFPAPPYESSIKALAHGIVDLWPYMALSGARMMFSGKLMYSEPLDEREQTLLELLTNYKDERLRRTEKAYIDWLSRHEQCLAPPNPAQPRSTHHPEDPAPPSFPRPPFEDSVLYLAHYVAEEHPFAVLGGVKIELDKLIDFETPLSVSESMIYHMVRNDERLRWWGREQQAWARHMGRDNWVPIKEDLMPGDVERMRRSHEERYGGPSEGETLQVANDRTTS
ncbi:hypothetical protein NA57DRAFT_79437 [Rhizodiscina lignyota]|uniref:Uncharacterized protein n=1 Tax=Rhizodiscina lignyota TaxID=1504668 RepID=A0A9P4M5W4_9PEZI|nr:hypothetical protein NA57DRAFT_79437 [Rhizodiscina lignyota]